MDDQVLRLLVSGKSQLAISNELSVPYHRVKKLAKRAKSFGLRCPSHRLSAEQVNEILRLREEEGLTIREIAARMSRHHSAIHKLIAHAIDSVGEYQPRGVRKAKRCSVHGLVRIWPCVACEALKTIATK